MKFLFFSMHRTPGRAGAALRLAAATMLALSLVGCAHVPAQTPTQIEPGVSYYETSQPTAVGTKTRLWVYLPTGVTGKIPCVVIAPAGSPLVWGMDLADGDRPEHLPYVRAGFAVVAYSIDGAVPDQPTDADAMTGLAAFRSAHAGVSDTYAAIDYVRAKLPQVDPARLYVAGHSSAGTLALLAAESDPRIKACAAYAPACDLVTRNDQLIAALQPKVPDITSFLAKTSPLARASDLHCPLYLFHADDDSTVLSSDVDAFREKVTRTNPHVKFVTVAHGGHYDSMLAEGVPGAIVWLKSLH
jgi:dipeptidyl aminopeptidase/acylaminoacyl peptidase